MIDFLKENFIWIAGIATAAKWVYEYSQKLRWEKSKFLLERLEDFLSNDSTEKVHKILDWNKVKIDFGGEKIVITDDILFEALQTHDIKKTFTETELKLRCLFDEYLDDMTEFLILSECGLLEKRDFRKFMKYWIDIISAENKRKPQHLHDQFQRYMSFYGFEKLLVFIKKKPIFDTFCFRL